MSEDRSNEQIQGCNDTRLSRGRLALLMLERWKHAMETRLIPFMSQASDEIAARINALKEQGKCVCKLSWPIHVAGLRFAFELLSDHFELINRVEFEAEDEVSALKIRTAVRNALVRSAKS